MPDEVTLDVTTIEENVTVETTAGDVVEIQVLAPSGAAATITVGTTTTLAPGSSATVANAGTSSAAVLNFGIPTGATGATGPAGPNSVTSATTSNGTASLDISNLTLSQAITSGLQTKMTFTANPTAVGDGQQIIWQWYNGGSPITTAAISSESTGSTSDKLIFKTSQGASVATSLDLTYALATFSGSISSLGESYRATSTFTYASGVAATHRTALGLTTLATTTPAANVATFLATPSSANLAAAVTDETGSGSLVFATSPTLTTPTIAAINGGTAANDDITIQGTTNATRTTSYVNLQPSGGNVGIGTSSPLAKMHVSNGSNTLTSGVEAVLFVDSGNSLYNAEFKGSASYTGFLLTNTITTGVPFVQFQNSANAVTWTIQQENAASSNALAIREGSAVGTTRFTIATGGSAAFGTATPSSKAILELASTSKGFLPPRMTTTQRDAITSVPAGLMIYNTTTNKLNVYTTAWEQITSA